MISIPLVKRRVEEIRAVKRDSEVAHVMEDQLYRDVLKHLADTYEGHVSQICKEALKSQEIEFGRWCG